MTTLADRRRDAYETLCRLYGEHNAPALMHVRGACNPRVAGLALAMGRCRAAVRAAKIYRGLGNCLPPGYLKLMTAANYDGTVRLLVARVGAGERFRPWEVDTAVSAVLAVADANGY